MLTNNAEVTEQADVEATQSTTEANAIDVEQSTTGEQSSGVEEKEQSQIDSDLVYDLDGEEVSVSQIREWKKGHMLQSDYTKKRQADAEFRKQLESKSQEVETVKTQLNDMVSELEAVIARDSDPKEMAELREYDYVEYQKRKEEIDERKRLAQKVKDELKAINDSKEAERIAEETDKFLKLVPEWQDPKKKDAEVKLMNDYAASNEFSQSDIDALKSHKIMKTVLDAAKYQKLKKEVEETGKQVDSAPNAIKPKPKQQKKATSLTERFYGKQA